MSFLNIAADISAAVDSMIGPSPKTPFIVYALPRSRTAWLAAFLTYDDWHCTHDQAVTFRTLQDARDFFAREEIGTVETGMSPGWRLITAARPGIRQVVIRRPVAEVIESFRALDVSAIATYDWGKLRRNLDYMDRCLQQIAARPGVLSIDFADLESEGACRAIFEHCLPYAFDRRWWLSLRDRNIQVDVVEQLRYCLANRVAINAFKSACWAELRKLARSARGRAHLQIGRAA